MVRNAFQKKFPDHGQALNTLIKNAMVGITALEQEEKLNEEFLPPPMPRFTLNAKQNEIYQALSPYLDAENKESKTALLSGHRKRQNSPLSRTRPKSPARKKIRAFARSGSRHSPETPPRRHEQKYARNPLSRLPKPEAKRTHL